jgi:hypothetical protein
MFTQELKSGLLGIWNWRMNVVLGMELFCILRVKYTLGKEW